MLRWLSFIPLAFALALPAKAQDAATLGKLPEVHVMTALKSGDWDDFGDKINEAFEEVEEQADDRNIKLADAEVVIYEVIGLKTFRIRAGYLIDPASKVKPGRVGKNMEVRLLKGPAYVATGEWRGRAGGYAIQERGGDLIAQIDGDYLNVVGLPFELLLALMDR